LANDSVEEHKNKDNDERIRSKVEEDANVGERTSN
jgi:hypothetical protein